MYKGVPVVNFETHLNTSYQRYINHIEELNAAGKQGNRSGKALDTLHSAVGEFFSSYQTEVPVKEIGPLNKRAHRTDLVIDGKHGIEVKTFKDSYGKNHGNHIKHLAGEILFGGEWDTNSYLYIISAKDWNDTFLKGWKCLIEEKFKNENILLCVVRDGKWEFPFRQPSEWLENGPLSENNS